MYIRLTQAERNQLRQIAINERRDLREQAAVLVAEGIARRRPEVAVNETSPGAPDLSSSLPVPEAPAVAPDAAARFPWNESLAGPEPTAIEVNE